MASDCERVLLLHNAYRERGGEERAVDDIAALLTARGHAVELLGRSSAGLGRGGAAAALLRGGVAPEAVTVAVSRTGADIVHAHNLHPLLGPRALIAARRAGARTVLHLHNFRFACAIGIAYRDGAPCFRCRGRDTRPGVRLRCRGSLPEAGVYAAALALHQPSLVHAVDRFVALSAATARRLAELGVPSERTDVLPNFLPASAFASGSAADSGSYALYAGRLVSEKGVDTAIAAARAAGVPLRIAGAGPDEGRLRALAAGADVTFLGRLTADALEPVRAGAAVALVPSRCEEQCPYAVLEAMAGGVPVMTSDLGGLPELAGRDTVLPAEDVPVWAERLRTLWEDPGRRRAAGEAALARARERNGPERFAAGLAGVYARARGARMC